MSPGHDAVKGGKLNDIHVAAPTPSTSPFNFFNINVAFQRNTSRYGKGVHRKQLRAKRGGCYEN